VREREAGERLRVVEMRESEDGDERVERWRAGWQHGGEGGEREWR
jgi:hypothetical protein